MEIIDIKKYSLVCEDPDATPIVLACDNETFNVHEISAIIALYQKATFIMHVLKGYGCNPLCSVAAVGVAYGPTPALQVTEFSNAELKDIHQMGLSQFVLAQSHVLMDACSALAAYYYATHVQLAVNDHGKKGHFFYIGRGTPESYASQDVIYDATEEVPLNDVIARDAFKKLQEKYHVYHIFSKPGDLKLNLDEEIRLNRWKKMLGEQNVFAATHPYLVGDMIMGILAVKACGKTLLEFKQDLRLRQPDSRVKAVITAIKGITK